jgi:hypothetical protein
MSTNMVLHAKTAQSQSVKFASLTQEVVRRLLHTSRMLPLSNRMDNLERLSNKMATSGHKPEYIRSIMIAGIFKFEKKFMKSQLPTSHKEYKPLHLGTHYNSLGRWKTKAMGADSWYEDKDKEDSEVRHHQEKKAGKRKKFSQKAENAGIKTSTVMFVPSSKGDF